jgi:hypothetical protein
VRLFSCSSLLFFFLVRLCSGRILCSSQSTVSCLFSQLQHPIILDSFLGFGLVCHPWTLDTGHWTLDRTGQDQLPHLNIGYIRPHAGMGNIALRSKPLHPGTPPWTIEFDILGFKHILRTVLYLRQPLYRSNQESRR